MLRSLVGSEMCIRDSISYYNYNYYYTTNTIGGVTNMDTNKKKVVLAYSCLLYTSDAADDLLCVDLGGRRIIKKKNYKTISWHNSLHIYIEIQ